MRLDIAICTWNRASELRRLLLEFEKCDKPKNVSFSINIIDNNSSDETYNIVNNGKFSFKLNYFVEKKQGLSHARNKALENCDSDWILFTDDDVSIGKAWIANWVTELQNLSSDIAFAGGGVKPRFTFTPNPHQLESMPMISSGFCGITAPDKKLITSNVDVFPMGANFALNRNKVCGKVFNTNLGVNGKNRILGEERAFMASLVNNGCIGQWLDNVTAGSY